MGLFTQLSSVLQQYANNQGQPNEQVHEHFDQVAQAVPSTSLADGLAAAFRSSKWVERALNWSFAAIFTAFAATILTAQARH